MDIKNVKEILEAISDEDAELMGFNPKNGSHPVNMIMRALIVTPPITRLPDMRNGVIIPSETTTVYAKIVKTNNEIQNGGRKRFQSVTDIETHKQTLISNLYQQIKHLFENSGSEYSTGTSFKSFKELIQGKRAIIRDLLMGKRNNFSARTVLGPAPSLKFGQIAIPSVFASSLTTKENVCQYNIEYLTGLLEETEYYKVKKFQAVKSSKLIKVKGRKITHIKYGPLREHPGDLITLLPGKKYDLKYGDEVWRHLRNGDMIMFGRQPTLHKHSLVAYEVVLSDQFTIGLHRSYTTPHNAD